MRRLMEDERREQRSSWEETEVDVDGGWSPRRGELGPTVYTAGRLLILGALGLGVWSTWEQCVGPLDRGRWVWKLVRTVGEGSGYGLLCGTCTILTVWVVEVLSASTGLVVTLHWVPLMGLLLGAVGGALTGLGRAVDLLGPAPWYRAVVGGVNGVALGVRVACTGGLVIGGLMCAVAAVPARRVLQGRPDLRVAPLLSLSVVLGMTWVTLSLAPEAMGMATLAGALLGEGGDPVGLVTVLVRVPVGAAMAVLVWRVAEGACGALKTEVEALFAAISRNVHHRPGKVKLMGGQTADGCTSLSNKTYL